MFSREAEEDTGKMSVAGLFLKDLSETEGAMQTRNIVPIFFPLNSKPKTFKTLY